MRATRYLVQITLFISTSFIGATLGAVYGPTLLHALHVLTTSL